MKGFLLRGPGNRSLPARFLQRYRQARQRVDGRVAIHHWIAQFRAAEMCVHVARRVTCITRHVLPEADSNSTTAANLSLVRLRALLPFMTKRLRSVAVLAGLFVSGVN